MFHSMNIVIARLKMLLHCYEQSDWPKSIITVFVRPLYIHAVMMFPHISHVETYQ